MTSRKTSLTLTAGKPAAASGSLFARVLADALARQRHRKSLIALSRLDDHLLSDIGLTRTEAEDQLFSHRI